MILLVHLLLGALIGGKIPNLFLAIILAFFSHYLLDLFPHVEYSIKNIESNNWRKAMPEILKVILDFSIGILLISLFFGPSVIEQPIIYICAIFAILPDGLSLLEQLIKNKILQKHSEIHQNRIHFLKNKKFPIFWRIASQIAAVIIFLILFKI